MSERSFQGIGVSRGIRRGKVCLFQHGTKPDAERKIQPREADAETDRFNRAAERAVREVEELIAKTAGKLKEEELSVIRGQKTILSDPAYCPEIRKLIREELLKPEKAVSQVTEKYAAIFENMQNSYMRERAADVRDAGNRLLGILTGADRSGLAAIDHPVILVADDLSPSDTVQLNRDFILAFATERGGKTSHTSIFAKSLRIPAVVGLTGILEAVSDGEELILDGSEGICIAAPEPDTVAEYERRGEEERKKEELYLRSAQQDARTSDGKRIVVAANIGSYADAAGSSREGAEAVGLFRTEQVYLSRQSSPGEEIQFQEYKKIAECYSPREVIVRTLDIGGDKNVKYLGIASEANPFLGYRAIRLCLDRKELFQTQLRAILRASRYGKLAIMFPMISDYEELAAAKAMLEEAKKQLAKEEIPFDDQIKTGMMIEVPSAALMADVLAKEVDFFSIGTNDLVQYSLAVDRGNKQVSYLYDYCHPAVARLIRQTSEAAHANQIPIGMCGSMAGDPLAVPLLIGLGLDELSMASDSIAQVKYEIGRLAFESCRNLAETAVNCKSAREVRNLLLDFRSGVIRS
ncbi:phosphoenolpyruvate--protein phosphotransferase [Clostridium sp. W14A]|nr:phosphoenolpyruvate--protein phosphotransferase [Clostridium sp. W14A]